MRPESYLVKKTGSVKPPAIRLGWDVSSLDQEHHRLPANLDRTSRFLRTTTEAGRQESSVSVHRDDPFFNLNLAQIPTVAIDDGSKKPPGTLVGATGHVSAARLTGVNPTFRKKSSYC